MAAGTVEIDGNYHTYTLDRTSDTTDWVGTISNFKVTFPFANMVAIDRIWVENAAGTEEVDLDDFSDTSCGWTLTDTATPPDAVQSAGELEFFTAASANMSKTVSVDADTYKVIKIRMLAGGDGTTGMIRWSVSGSTFKPTAYPKLFDINNDGAFHKYTILLSDEEGWGPYAKYIEFIPTNASGVDVEIDYIHALSFEASEDVVYFNASYGDVITAEYSSGGTTIQSSTMDTTYLQAPPRSAMVDGYGGSVFVHNGEFIETATDLTFPGLGVDFAFARTYRSYSTHVDYEDEYGNEYVAPLGNKWDFTYNMRLQKIAILHDNDESTTDETNPVNTVIRLYDGAGRMDQYTIFKDNNGDVVTYTPTNSTQYPNQTWKFYKASAGVFDEIVEVLDSSSGATMYYLLRTKHRTDIKFIPCPTTQIVYPKPPSTVSHINEVINTAVLRSITNRNGNAVTVYYVGEGATPDYTKINYIEDSRGVHMKFVYYASGNNEGRISTVFIDEDNYGTLDATEYYVWQYYYDDNNGDLTAVESPQGWVATSLTGTPALTRLATVYEYLAEENHYLTNKYSELYTTLVSNVWQKITSPSPRAVIHNIYDTEGVTQLYRIKEQYADWRDEGTSYGYVFDYSAIANHTVTVKSPRVTCGSGSSDYDEDAYTVYELNHTPNSSGFAYLGLVESIMVHESSGAEGEAVTSYKYNSDYQVTHVYQPLHTSAHHNYLENKYADTEYDPSSTNRITLNSAQKDFSDLSRGNPTEEIQHGYYIDGNKTITTKYYLENRYNQIKAVSDPRYPGETWNPSGDSWGNHVLLSYYDYEKTGTTSFDGNFWKQEGPKVGGVRKVLEEHTYLTKGRIDTIVKLAPKDSGTVTTDYDYYADTGEGLAKNYRVKEMTKDKGTGTANIVTKINNYTITGVPTETQDHLGTKIVFGDMDPLDQPDQINFLATVGAGSPPSYETYRIEKNVARLVNRTYDSETRKVMVMQGQVIEPGATETVKMVAWKVTDDLGQVRESYVGLGSLTDMTDSGNPHKQYEYDFNGNLVLYTDPDGKEVIRTYTPADRLEETKTSAGVGTLLAYNKNGLLQDMTILGSPSGGALFTQLYDGFDRSIISSSEYSYVDSAGANQTKHFSVCTWYNDDHSEKHVGQLHTGSALTVLSAEPSEATVDANMISWSKYGYDDYHRKTDAYSYVFSGAGTIATRDTSVKIKKHTHTDYYPNGSVKQVVRNGAINNTDDLVMYYEWDNLGRPALECLKNDSGDKITEHTYSYHANIKYEDAEETVYPGCYAVWSKEQNYLSENGNPGSFDVHMIVFNNKGQKAWSVDLDADSTKRTALPSALFDGSGVFEPGDSIVDHTIFDLLGDSVEVKQAEGTDDEKVTVMDYDTAGRLRYVVSKVNNESETNPSLARVCDYYLSGRKMAEYTLPYYSGSLQTAPANVSKGILYHYDNSGRLDQTYSQAVYAAYNADTKVRWAEFDFLTSHKRVYSHLEHISKELDYIYSGDGSSHSTFNFATNAVTATTSLEESVCYIRDEINRVRRIGLSSDDTDYYLVGTVDYDLFGEINVEKDYDNTTENIKVALQTDWEDIQAGASTFEAFNINYSDGRTVSRTICNAPELGDERVVRTEIMSYSDFGEAEAHFVSDAGETKMVRDGRGLIISLSLLGQTFNYRYDGSDVIERENPNGTKQKIVLGPRRDIKEWLNLKSDESHIISYQYQYTDRKVKRKKYITDNEDFEDANIPFDYYDYDDYGRVTDAYYGETTTGQPSPPYGGHDHIEWRPSFPSVLSAFNSDTNGDGNYNRNVAYSVPDKEGHVGSITVNGTSYNRQYAWGGARGELVHAPDRVPTQGSPKVGVWFKYDGTGGLAGVYGGATPDASQPWKVESYSAPVEEFTDKDASNFGRHRSLSQRIRYSVSCSKKINESTVASHVRFRCAEGSRTPVYASEQLNTFLLTPRENKLYIGYNPAQKIYSWGFFGKELLMMSKREGGMASQAISPDNILTDNGKSWVSNQFRNMWAVLSDAENSGYYKILSNTENTLTLQSEVGSMTPITTFSAPGYTIVGESYTPSSVSYSETTGNTITVQGESWANDVHKGKGILLVRQYTHPSGKVWHKYASLSVLSNDDDTLTINGPSDFLQEKFPITSDMFFCFDLTTDYVFHSDGAGNVVAITNENGEDVERYTYSIGGDPKITKYNGSAWVPSVDGRNLFVSSIGNSYMWGTHHFREDSRLYQIVYPNEHNDYDDLNTEYYDPRTPYSLMGRWSGSIETRHYFHTLPNLAGAISTVTTDSYENYADKAYSAHKNALNRLYGNGDDILGWAIESDTAIETMFNSQARALLELKVDLTGSALKATYDVNVMSSVASWGGVIASIANLPFIGTVSAVGGALASSTRYLKGSQPLTSVTLDGLIKEVTDNLLNNTNGAKLKSQKLVAKIRTDILNSSVSDIRKIEENVLSKSLIPEKMTKQGYWYAYYGSQIYKQCTVRKKVNGRFEGVFYKNDIVSPEMLQKADGFTNDLARRVVQYWPNQIQEMLRPPILRLEERGYGEKRITKKHESKYWRYARGYKKDEDWEFGD